MALVVGGTTVTGTQTVLASVLTGTASAINGSNITNLPASTPSNADILNGVASATAGVVGSYGLILKNSGSSSVDSTYSSNLYWSNAKGGASGQPSGTWRAMGHTAAHEDGRRATVFLRTA
jgi:hypothetical protein